MELNSVLYLFPFQLSCTYSVSLLSWTSIFQIWPVHSLEWAVLTILCQSWQQDYKTLSCGGQEQEQLVNTASSTAARIVSFRVSPLLTIGQQQSKDAL